MKIYFIWILKQIKTENLRNKEAVRGRSLQRKINVANQCFYSLTFNYEKIRPAS